MQKHSFNAFVIVSLTLLHHSFASSMDRDTLKTAATISAIAAGCYGIGYISAYCAHRSANKRYEKARALVTSEKSPESMQAQLQKLIAHDNVYYYDRDSAFRNYPQVQFKKDLDGVISNLNFLWFFTIGTQLKGEMTLLLNDLKKLRHVVITSPTYIDERRYAEERIENRKVHVVVHGGLLDLSA